MTHKLTVTALALALALTACAPRTQSTPASTPTTRRPPATPGAPTNPTTPPGGNRVLTDPTALEVDRAARQAFHLMGLEHTRMGAYSVNTLVSDLELPSGARWELEDLQADSYTLRFTSDNVPDVAWLVTPEGVEAQQVSDNGIL